MSEVIDGEIVNELAVVERGNLLAASTGKALVERATERATALAAVIKAQNLTTTISGRDHVRVEGWTLLGSMMGVFPVVDSVKELYNHDGTLYGFEARVEARTISGATVGAAIARCTRDEDNWGAAKGAKGYSDDFALMSMAQTRATSKALRMPLGFVMALAGYDPTPAEEMSATQAQPAKPTGGAGGPAAGSAPEAPSSSASDKPKSDSPPASTKQIKALWAIAASKGIRDELKALIQAKYGCDINELTGGGGGTASDAIDFLQNEDEADLRELAAEAAGLIAKAGS